MREQYDLLRRADIVTICVFRSTPQNIAKYAADVVNTGKLLALGDARGAAYESYMIGKSASGFLRDALRMVKNIYRYKEYVHVDGMIRDMGKVTQMPADFMINEEGIIVDLERGGLMRPERVETFIPHEKRCGCNKKTCIWPFCRAQYEVIRNEGSFLIYMG